MLELKIKAGRRHIPIFDLPAALGRKGAYQEIGDQIDALIAFMDDLQGDVDLEDSEASMSNIDACGRLLPGNYVGAQDEDREPDDDAQGDQSWPEWHTLRAADRRAGNNRGKALPTVWHTPQEDDEDSDAEEDDDPAGGNVLDMEMDEDAQALQPLYGIDQSRGPVNALIANQRHEILSQIAMHSGGDSRWLKQLHARLAVLDERQAAIVAAASSNDN